jgi:predicted O-linked N-acetylglucosamine transferase (SPINDLY family)
LVVGYISERFRNAATAHLMLQLFGLHDRNRITVHAYSFGKDDHSRYRQRLAQDADRFVDIRQYSDADAARCIPDDGVQILVDLMGHMQHNRMGILAFRPAPVQVTYLGYPGTTGARFMDYLIADHEVIPAGEDHSYSERLVRLPHSYQLNDNTQTVSEQPFDRRTCNLPEEGFVYCSFNTDYKIDGDTFSAWMRILDRVPDSVLWLLVRSPETRQNLSAAAVNAGIDNQRLIFADSLPKEEHLARIQLADLALDTLTVNGHTTTSDCLWVNLPVVTVKGLHFPSRVSASLLKAVGLPALVCGSVADYEDLAVTLAQDPQQLFRIKCLLGENKKRAALFDTQRTVRNLETAYLRMWDRHIQGLAPVSFSVLDDDIRQPQFNGNLAC